MFSPKFGSFAGFHSSFIFSSMKTAVKIEILKLFSVCRYVPRSEDDKVCLFLSVVVGQRLIHFSKQNSTFVRKGFWICLPPYFSVRDSSRIFFCHHLSTHEQDDIF
jgi:hypothetical protein